eukprot:621382-Hanusia_phi.AAC.2
MSLSSHHLHVLYFIAMGILYVLMLLASTVPLLEREKHEIKGGKDFTTNESLSAARPRSAALPSGWPVAHSGRERLTMPGNVVVRVEDEAMFNEGAYRSIVGECSKLHPE